MRPWQIAVVFIAAVLVLVVPLLWLAEQAPAPRSAPLPPADPENPGEGPEAQHRRLDVEDLVGLYPRYAVRQGPGDDPRVALTFDDGPDDLYTPQVLDVLEQEGVRATFFITGVRAEENPEVLRRIIREGHAAASHGYLHARYSALSPAQIRADLARNRRLLQEAGSPHGWLFRPPYGSLDTLAMEALIEEGYRVVLWTVDTLDWRQRGADEIVATVLAETRNGSIILQHSGGAPGQDLSATVAALPRIIEGLRRRGFEFVTVPELVAWRAPAAGR